MKIVTDFDGVVTDQTEEATLVGRLFADRLGDRWTPLLARGRDALTAHPDQHGWRSQDRITAYANEDLFILNNGLAACLDDLVAAGDTEAKGALATLDFPSFTQLAQWAYEEMVSRTHRGELKPMDPDAAEVMKRLLELGHEIVVVSNSGTDRIVELLARAGLTATAHGADETSRLRVRGGARKFELGAERRGFSFGAYWLDTSRPRYEEILREERPDAVIGDVLSLDLALPMHLAQSEPEKFGGMRFCLRVRPYTPAWARELLATHTGRRLAYTSPVSLLDWLNKNG